MDAGSGARRDWVATFVGFALGAIVVLVVVAISGSPPPIGEQRSAVSRPSVSEIVGVASRAEAGDPTAVVLPEVDNRVAAVAFLEGEGTDVVAMAARVVPLVSLEPPDRARCDEVADGLDELGEPAALFDAGSRVPDLVSAELSVDLAASTTRFLGVCQAGDEVLRGELAYQWVLLDRRLDQLGVSR